MEDDGITRVWRNMQDPELYALDTVVEEFPRPREYDEGFVDEEADALRSDADVAFRLLRQEPSRENEFRAQYSIEILVLATGERIILEDINSSMESYPMDEVVARTVEERLGRTGLTIISGSGFGFPEEEP